MGGPPFRGALDVTEGDRNRVSITLRKDPKLWNYDYKYVNKYIYIYIYRCVYIYIYIYICIYIYVYIYICIYTCVYIYVYIYIYYVFLIMVMGDAGFISSTVECGGVRLSVSGCFGVPGFRLLVRKTPRERGLGLLRFGLSGLGYEF